MGPHAPPEGGANGMLRFKSGYHLPETTAFTDYDRITHHSTCVQATSDFTEKLSGNFHDRYYHQHTSSVTYFLDRDRTTLLDCFTIVVFQLQMVDRYSPVDPRSF